MVSILIKSYNSTVAQFYDQEELEEHDIVPFMLTLLGAFILLFIIFVLAFAPGKTVARHGIIIDFPVTEMTQKGQTSHFLVLLNDGKAVKVGKPEWFVHSKRKSIILRETTTFFLRTKKYSFYDEERIHHQK